MPEFFYRYQGCSQSLLEDGSTPMDRALKLIASSSIYYATPDSFNDPFEFLVTPLESSLAEFKTYTARFPERIVNPSDLNPGEFRQIFRRQMRPILGSIFDNTLLKMKNRLGVLCLSTAYDSINLWSHYGDHHKGICFRFRNSPDSFFSEAKKVHYEISPPTMNYFKEVIHATEEFGRKLAFCKAASAWDKEQEYRIVEENSGFYSFPPKCLTAIYLGCEFNNKTFLAELARISPGLRVIKLKKKPKSYSLTIEWEMIASKIVI